MKFTNQKSVTEKDVKNIKKYDISTRNRDKMGNLTQNRIRDPIGL